MSTERDYGGTIRHIPDFDPDSEQEQGTFFHATFQKNTTAIRFDANSVPQPK